MEKIIFFIHVVLIVLWIYSCAWIDSEHYARQQWVIKHRSRMANRILVGLIVLIFNPFLGVFCAISFWSFFDGFLSKQRFDKNGNRFKWFYIGSIAGTDKFFSSPTDILGVRISIRFKVIFYKMTKRLSMSACLSMVFFNENIVSCLKEYLEHL